MQGLGALPLVDSMLDVVCRADPFAEVLELPSRPLPAEGGTMQSQSNSPDGASSGAKQPSTRVLCSVPDCGFDLTESTYYLKRHRVCEAHMKAKTVELDGNICRFCQQCGRFQPLTDFNGDRKSCDAALKAHNARRRQMNQDKTVLVNDRRSRGSRAKMQQDAGGGVDAGARVSRRLTARRTTSPWAATQDAAQQQQQRRPAGPACKEARSDGSHTAFAGNSRSPSASMQSSEDCDSQRYPPQQLQQQQQFAPEFPPIHSGTASPSRSSSHSRGGGCTAAHGCAQSAQQALSGSSDSGAPGQQLQPPGFVLDGSMAAKSSAGRSRLGMVASGSSGVPPLPESNLLLEQQQQLLSPALCTGMESSPSGSCAGQQGSLADWMTQHNPADIEQQLQQLWTAAAAAGQPCSAGLSNTAFDCVAAGNPGLMLSQGSTQQQQQSGWSPAAGQARPAADVWSPLPQAPLVQGSVPDHQQQQLSPPQQQEQCWVSMLLATDMEPTTAAPAPTTSGPNNKHSNGSSPAGNSLHAALTAMRPLPTLALNGQRQSASSAAPAPAAAAGAGGSDGCPGMLMGAPAAAAAGGSDSCAVAFMGAPKQQADSLVEPLDPLDSSLEDALDLLDVMLAEVPEWQLLQPSSAAGTTEAGTSGTRTSSSPGSSDGQLPNPSGRLSDISWADFADLGTAVCAEGTTAAWAEGAAAAGQACHIRQVPAAGAPGAGTAAAAAGGLDEACMAKPGMLAAGVPVPAPAAAAGAAFGMLAGASMAACGPQAALGMLPATLLQAYAPMGVGGTAVAGQPFLAGPSLQPGVLAGGASAAPSTAVVLGPGFSPPAVAAQLGAPAVCGQQATMVMAGLPGNNGLGWGPEPVCQPAGVAAGVSPAAAAVPGMQPNDTTSIQQKQQPLQPLPADPSLALLQQEHQLAQQQLQQQQMLQQLHWQQRQQLLQQHTQLKHYLVRLSVKLHGVMPEQLPSHTVLAMERLVLENAGLMDAIMLQPSFRQGCVQMEFDLLVKPRGPMPAHHAAAGQPAQQEQQGGAAGGNSNNSKGMQAAGEWSAVAAALGSCPGTAAAEAQLRQALPFSLLLDTLLALPLLPNTAGSVVSEADLDCDLDSTADGDSSAGLPYDSQDSDAGSKLDCWDSGSLPSLTASQSSAHTAGSAVRAVYAQIGDSVAVWTAAQGLVQDWTAVAGTAVSGAGQEHSSAGTTAGVAGAGLRPALVTAGPLCTAPTAGQHMTQLGSLSPVLLQSVVWPGSSSASCADLADDTASTSDSQHSSSETVKLWCTAGGEFVPLAARPAADSAAGGSVIAASSELLLCLQSQHMPGLLLLQAEQLHASSGKNGGKLQHSSGQMLLGDDDPLPLKSVALPVVVCPSAKVAAEVRSVLLGAVSPPDAALLLQQLGLLLDFRRMLQQQHDAGPKTDRQQWASGLLCNSTYLEVMRSTCLSWLMFAGIHDMTATASTLLSIWCSLRSSSAAAAAAQAASDDASPAGSQQDAVTAVAEEPSAATQQSPSTAAAAAAGTATVASSGPKPAAASLVQRTPVEQWVFEDVDCGSSSGNSSSAVPTQEVSTQTPGGHLTDARPGMSVGNSRLLSAFSVLVVLLAVLVAKHTGWLPRALNLLHAMWVPLVVLTAGSILGLIVLWQQPGSWDVGGDYGLFSDEPSPCSKLGSAGGKYAAAMGGVAEDEHRGYVFQKEH